MNDSPDLDRRNFVLGRLSEKPHDKPESHVSSLVVQVRPQMADAVTHAVSARSGAEVHARDPMGKFVVTLETQSEFEIIEHLNAIQELPGVLSASLVFHHFESEQP